MTAIRVIVALLISISLAIAPMALPQASVANPVTVANGSVDEMACCGSEHFKISVECAAKCLHCAVIIPGYQTAPPPGFAIALVSFGNERLRAHVRSPPTHPPIDGVAQLSA